MADIVFVIYFVLLLTLATCPGKAEYMGLQEDDLSNESQENVEPPELLDHKFYNTPTQRLFKCHICDDKTECYNPRVCENALVCWKSSVRDAEGVEQNKRGCTTEPEQIPMICNNNKPLIVTVRENEKTLKGQQRHVECCQADYCNEGPYPVLQELNSDENKEDYVLKLTLAVLAPLVFLCLIAASVCFFIFSRRTKRNRKPKSSRHNKLLMEADLEPAMLHFTSSSHSSSTYHPHELKATAAGDSTLKEYLDGRSLTSGSGSGLPLLVQRTLAKQVALVECIGSGGSGGFGGEVWRGIWHGENVAVKIYFSRDEAAWVRETEVHSQLLPSRHDNILGYVGSDMTSRSSCTQLWLVTHYHPLGSLYDYLNRSNHPLNHHQIFNICLGIVDGLLYLHTEICGTKGKPAMAHRNLKSKNILVKSNGACVIADFCLAVTQDRLATEKIDLKQGSKRYMSPEILEQKINIGCLESFRCADIYSLGLILWEVCRRCLCNGVALDYASPYAEWLAAGNQEPSLEEMRKLVCLDQRRPPLPNRWHSDSTLTELGKLMRECWHGKPAARLPILRVKKTLVKLAANDSRVHLPID